MCRFVCATVICHFLCCENSGSDLYLGVIWNNASRRFEFTSRDVVWGVVGPSIALCGLTFVRAGVRFRVFRTYQVDDKPTR